MQLLYHHGFLERPRAQIDYYHEGGSRQMVYGLGNKGGKLKKKALGVTAPRHRWGEKNRSVGRIYLEHALLVSDVTAAIEMACRQSGKVRLLVDEDLPIPGAMPAQRHSFRWKVDVGNKIKLGLIPDRVFALEFVDRAGRANRAYYFLEADRGTMPVIRRSLSQTSFYRKLLAYEATWSQSIHKRRFGFDRFRMLTVTKSAARMESLLNACGQLGRGHGLFLFSERTVSDAPGEILSAIWQTCRPGKTSTLMD
jgi:hypothetical protein